MNTPNKMINLCNHITVHTSIKNWCEHCIRKCIGFFRIDRQSLIIYFDKANPLCATNLDFETIILADKPKPLPEPFNSLPEGSVVRNMPTNYSRGTSPKIAVDADIAFGYAATTDLPDYPFFFGYAPR